MKTAARAAGPAVARPNSHPEKAYRACSEDVDRLQLDVKSRPGVVRVLLDDEADFCARAELAPPLEELEVHTDVLVDLDLTHPRFNHVATIRPLGCFARRLRHTGRVVVTTGASSTLPQGRSRPCRRRRPRLALRYFDPGAPSQCIARLARRPAHLVE